MRAVKEWLQATPYKDYEISVASVDASFRKYYRINKEGKSFIIMDSSLELDSLKPFLDVSSRLLNVGVKAPIIYEENIELGFLILQDFGSRNLLDVLDETNFKMHYLNAIKEIVKMQDANCAQLPFYDKKFLHFEMDLMSEWYLQKHLSISLSELQEKIIKNALEKISKVVLSQPQNVFVHRDFHSRNIMLTPKDEIGVIDHQDAMCGAITYDLVSLLKDCYIEFNPKDIEELALAYRDMKKLSVSDAEFLKWFDFMGLQRHIKVLGVFSRLSIRDKKDAYLKDIPLTLKYTIQTALKYDETKEFAQLLQEVTL